MGFSKRKSECAKKKLKTYLSNSAAFTPTQKKARYWFNVINTAAFKNKITFSNILVKNMRSNWGLCTHEGDLTEITVDAGISTRELFIATIAHEMVHLLQVQTKKSMNHSAYYLKWKRFFKKHYNITL